MWVVLTASDIAAAQTAKPLGPAELQAEGSTAAQTRAEVHLFFSDDRNYYLRAENRTLTQSGDPVIDGRQIVLQLLQGPKEGLNRVIPEGTRLRSFFVTRDGTAYADFSDALSEKHPGGCRLEMLTVFSIVDSLVLNVPDIKQVGILIAGQEIQTLAGHIDTRFPFKADMLLIR